MKAFESITQPDERSTFLSYRKRQKDGSYSGWQRLDLEYYYDLAASCALPETLPENVREIWKVAQHLLVYTIYDHSFLEASNLYCSLAVEAALTDFCKEEIESFRQERSKNGKKFRDLGFYDVCQFFEKKVSSQLSEEEMKFMHNWLEVVRTIRNKMAHLKKHQPLWVSYSHLPISAEFLKNVFEEKLKPFFAAWMKHSAEENERMMKMIEEAKRQHEQNPVQ